MSAAISPDRMAARRCDGGVASAGGAKRGAIWGRSGKADAKMIHGESQSLSLLPDSAAYLNVLITFAERLRESHADQSADGRYRMENIAGNLSQNLLRKTGKLQHGLRALTNFAAMVDVAKDPRSGLAMHSYALGSYSLLTMYGEETLAAVTEDPEFRMHAIAIANDAAGRFEQAAKQGEQGADTARAHPVCDRRLVPGRQDYRRTAADGAEIF
jgi:hypothetical protein